MKLSEGIEWALHCVSVLATLPPGATLPTKALAEYHGLSETYLAKHLQALANAAIVASIPGPKGGYCLVRAPETITLLDVVEAIDGKAPIFRCTEIRQQSPFSCPPETYRIPCGIHTAMAKAEKAWREALRAQNIGDMVANYTKHVKSGQRQQALDWFAERARMPLKPA